MKKALPLTGLAVLLAVVACDCNAADAKNKKDDPKKDAKKLQGTWSLESLEVGGQKSAAEDIKNETLTIKGAVWTLSFGPNKPTNRAVVFIDPTKDPKLIELRTPRGLVRWSGLYKLEDDTLTICRPIRLLRQGGKRPKDFTSAQDNMLWV